MAESSYRLVPKDQESNVRFRMHVLEKAAEDHEFRALMMLFCSKSVLFFFNVFIWSLDTRKKNPHTPFITYQIQDDAILKIVAAIESEEQGLPPIVIEKSRDMGASWMILLIFLWYEIFFPRQLEFFMMSYKKELVDGDADSLFGKMDVAIASLPGWMKGSLKRTEMRIRNLLTGTITKGQSTTEKSGIAGRYRAMLFDEFPLVDDAETIYDKTGDCSNVRIFVGTPNGTHTKYYQLTQDASVTKIRMHWTSCPWKTRGLYVWHQHDNEPTILDTTYKFPPNYEFIRHHNPGRPRSVWYDFQCKRRGWSKIAIAQELDIDYQAAVWLFFDVAEIDRLVATYCRDPHHRGHFQDGRFVEGPTGWKLWVKLDGRSRPPHGRYGIGCDVASGTGGKYGTASCASVVNLDTGEKIASFKSPHVTPAKFARIVHSAAVWFNHAIVNWEAQGATGTQFRQTLMDECEHANVYFRKKGEDTLTPVITDKIGWDASADRQHELLESYRGALSSGEFLNPEREAMEETKKFIYDQGVVKHTLQLVKDDPSGAKANHGDDVIADALAWILLRDDGTVSRRIKAIKAGEPEVMDVAPVGSWAWRDAQDQAQSSGEW